MGYFKDFDLVSYDFTIKGDKAPIVEVLVDLMQRVQFKLTKEELGKLCDNYLIPPNTKPEQLAAQLYNDPQLHWTILYVNDITDIHNEWPLPEIALSAFVTSKYGSGNEHMPHHYEKMPERLVMDSAFIDATYGVNSKKLITNYDYEYELNDVKRYIRVIKPVYIAGFVQAFNKALVNG